MQYMLLLYREDAWRDSLSDDEHAALNREYMELHDELAENGVLVAAAPLRPTDTATRTSGATARTKSTAPSSRSIWP